MGEYVPTNADQSLYGTSQNGWYVNSVGITSGALTTLDWGVIGDGGKYALATPYGNILIGKWGLGLRLVDDNASIRPGLSDNLSVTIYYTLTRQGSAKISDELSRAVQITGVSTSPGDVTAPVDNLASAVPANSATDVAYTQSFIIPFDEAITLNVGSLTIKDVTGATTLLVIDASDGTKVSTNGTDLLVTHGLSLPYESVIGVEADAGFVQNAVGLDWTGLGPGDYQFTIEDAPASGSTLTLPTPLYQSWDFDHQSVTWDTDVAAASMATVVSAINTALADYGTDPAPKYHRVRYTGGTLTGNQSLSIQGAAAGITDQNVYVCVAGANGVDGSYTVVDGEMQLTNAPRNVKFVGWQVQPVNSVNGSTSIGGGNFRADCFKVQGSTPRVSVGRCRMGLRWKGTYSPAEYPRGVRTDSANAKITMRDNEFMDVFEQASFYTGYHHSIDNLVFGLNDDGIFLTTRNSGNKFAYLYKARDVIADYADDPAFSGNHPDATQTGTSADASTDAYYVEEHQVVVLGNTRQQYPVHGAFIQPGGGSSAGTFQVKLTDCFYLVSGYRGVGLSDRRSELRRVFCAMPPTGGVPVQTGAGWGSGNIRQPGIWAEAARGAGNTPTFDTVLAHKFQNGSGWTQTEAEVVDYKVNIQAFSGAQSYDVAFPNLDAAGLLSVQSGPWGNQWVVANPSGAQMPMTRQGIRAFVSTYYEPYVAANGLGWEANGFNDPINIASPGY